MASATQTPQSTLKMTAMFGQTSHTPARPFTAMPAGPGLAPGLMSGAMPSTKEVNTASFCKIGQELSQDIVQKTLDVYQTLKLIQLPNDVNVTGQVYKDRKAKLDDLVRALTMNFKKLRVIYDKVMENTSTLDQRQAEDLLPVEDENWGMGGEAPRLTEVVKYVSDEHKLYVEQIRAKNQQMKEIIDVLRTVIWEINTMMAMRC